MKSNLKNSDLYDSILAFDLDGFEGNSESFRKKLAQDNGWTLSFAERVIREYKRFVYLAMSSKTPVTPSDKVDQAWHLHLTRSRNYWEKFCGTILNRALHHEANSKGPSGREIHEQQYAFTLKYYEQIFDEHPPQDIWPSVGEYWDSILACKRISTREYWIIPKPMRRFGFVVASVFAVLTCMFILGWSFPNPLRLKGMEYVHKVLLPVVGISVVLSILVYFIKIGPGFSKHQKVPLLSWSEMAYLQGGKNRLLITIIAELFARGILVLRLCRFNGIKVFHATCLMLDSKSTGV